MPETPKISPYTRQPIPSADELARSDIRVGLWFIVHALKCHPKERANVFAKPNIETLARLITTAYNEPNPANLGRLVAAIEAFGPENVESNENRQAAQSLR